MPTYDYVCHHCGHRFEVIHGVHAEGPSHCPVCHKGGVRKAISAPSIVFKGSGWAKKDRSSTSKSSSPAASSPSSTESSGSSASGASDDASAAKPASKPASDGASSSGSGAAAD
jgi:putative FmdB family regulatory protein